MPRRKRPRFVSGYPTISAFVPEGMPRNGEITLSGEGLETVRLSDFEKLDQAAEAEIMGISRQTYGRILAEARAIVSEALLTGKALRVSGGVFEMRGERRRRRGQRGPLKEVNTMPRRDGTGPEGQGPKTGRGAGNCGPGSRNNQTGGQQTGQGRPGRGQGRGGGRGRGNRQ